MRLPALPVAIVVACLVGIIAVLGLGLKAQIGGVEDKVVAIPEQAVDTSGLLRDPRFDETSTYQNLMWVCKAYSNGAAYEPDEPGFVLVTRCKMHAVGQQGINGPAPSA